jgi:DNA ligase (NAD+)
MLSDKEYITKLSRTIEEANAAYYNSDSPLMTDSEYDTQKSVLERLVTEHPEYKDIAKVALAVGAPVSESVLKYKHPFPMLSLAKILSEPIQASRESPLTYTHEALTKWVAKMKETFKDEPNLSFVIEPKFDGISLSLHYVNGVLDNALLRGDGYEGESIFKIIRFIKNIPLEIKEWQDKELVVIRGEVVMHRDDLDKLNQYQKEHNDVTFANPRNATAGTLRIKDITPLAKGIRVLHFYPYFASYAKYVSTDLLSLHQYGFDTYYQIRGVCKTLDPIIELYMDMMENRFSFPFDIDGMVIKIDKVSLREQCEGNSTDMKGANAYKFPPQEVVTTLIGVELQVGKHGTITPLAIFTPTLVGGVVVSRATLHNIAFMNSLNKAIGDNITIRRAGDVIPQVVPDGKPSTGQYKVQFTHCPYCDSELDINTEEGNKISYCPNHYCKARLNALLSFQVSRDAFDIKGISDKIIARLVEKEMVKSIADIYRLTADGWIRVLKDSKDTSVRTTKEETIDGIDAGKYVNNIMKTVNQSKTVPLHKFVYGLAIRYVGKTTAKVLANRFGSIEGLLTAKKNDLLDIDGLGINTANAVYSYFTNPLKIAHLNDLINVGIKIVNPLKQTGVLEDMSICITGSFNIPREEIINKIERNGGRVVSSVSKGTDYLLAGGNAGSKLEKAKALNISIIHFLEDILR